MNDTSSLIRLMSWLSPVFPTGSFAYSSGLEQATADGSVKRSGDLGEWVEAQLQSGGQWNDALFFVEAHRYASKGAPINKLVERAIAMTSASQRLNETLDQGTSFVKAAASWTEATELIPPRTPLPICVGWVCGAEKIELTQAIAAYLHAFTTNQLQAAIRLSLIGQSGAAETLAALEPTIEETANRAASSTLDDLGTCAFLADIAAMKHEILQPRLFQS